MMASSQSFQASAEAKTCHGCRKWASFQCFCSSSPILLCTKCAYVHFAQRLSLRHVLQPFIRPLKSQEDNQLQIDHLYETASSLRNNVKKISKCCSELRSAFNVAVAQENEYLREWLASMEQEREETSKRIEEAITEAYESVCSGDFPRNPLSKALIVLDPDELNVFDYNVGTLVGDPLIVDRLTRVSNNLNRLCGLFLEPNELVPEIQRFSARSALYEAFEIMQSYKNRPIFLEKSGIRALSLSRQVWDTFPVQDELQVDDDSRYIWTTSGLFASGGTSDNSFIRYAAYLFQGDWNVTRLCQMTTPRGRHGLWFRGIEGAIYSFSGLDKLSNY